MRVAAKTRCGVNQFECRHKKRCIPYVWRCDGDQDCHDGGVDGEPSSDEADCNDSQCQPGYIQCNDTKRSVQRLQAVNATTASGQCNDCKRSVQRHQAVSAAATRHRTCHC